jgi:hypothetical protein
MLSITTRTAAAFTVSGAVLLSAQPARAVTLTPPVSSTENSATGPAMAAHGVIAGPVLRKLAQILWAGASRAIEILFRIKLALNIKAQVDALKAITEDLKREVEEQSRVNAAMRTSGDARARAHAEQVAKGETTLKKMQVALALAPKATPMSAAPRKVRVKLDPTADGFQWRLDAPKDWKEEVMSPQGKQ